MRRIINFRAPLFIAIGLILGIISFYELLFGNFWVLTVSLAIVISVGVLLFVFRCKVKFGVIAVLVAVILGFFVSQLHYYLQNKNDAVQKEVTITGRVSDLCRNGEPSSAVYLEDCMDSNGIKYKGRVLTYVYNNSVNTGDVLEIRGTLNSVYPIKNSVQTYYLRNNVRYEMEIARIVSTQKGSLKLDETIRKYVYERSIQYAPNNGDVLYALLCGDRNALSSEKENNFKLAGVIHLLAVSGLHIGFVVAVLGFFLKKLKLHPLIECIILLIPLLFYAYICNFTPSVIRAIVMCACTYLARAAFARYDMLTSLSWAIIVLLLISPFNLFDTGFQLSVMSVFGIATIYSALNRILVKYKIPKILRYFVNSIAVSLSCSIATFFTLQINYGYAPLLGILLNLVAVPLVSVAFVLGWIGLLPWIFHYVLVVVDWLLQAVVVMAKWVAGTSVSTVAIPAISLTIVVVVAWLFVSGGYVNLRKIGKIITHAVLACLLALCVGLTFVKVTPQTQAFVVYDNFNCATCVVTSGDGNAVIVGNFANAYSGGIAEKHLNKYKITNCALYITNYGEADGMVVADALQTLPVSVVYKLDVSNNGEIDEIFSKNGIPVYQQQPNCSTGNSLVVNSVYDGGLKAAIITSSDFTVAVALANHYSTESFLNLNLPADIYVLASANEEYSNRNLITLSAYQANLPFNYGANKYGNFTITQKGDTINIKFK